MVNGTFLATSLLIHLETTNKLQISDNEYSDIKKKLALS